MAAWMKPPDLGMAKREGREPKVVARAEITRQGKHMGHFKGFAEREMR